METRWRLDRAGGLYPGRSDLVKTFVHFVRNEVSSELYGDGTFRSWSLFARYSFRTTLSHGLVSSEHFLYLPLWLRVIRLDSDQHCKDRKFKERRYASAASYCDYYSMNIQSVLIVFHFNPTYGPLRSPKRPMRTILQSTFLCEETTPGPSAQEASVSSFYQVGHKEDLWRPHSPEGTYCSAHLFCY